MNELEGLLFCLSGITRESTKEANPTVKNSPFFPLIQSWGTLFPTTRTETSNDPI